MKSIFIYRARVSKNICKTITFKESFYILNPGRVSFIVIFIVILNFLPIRYIFGFIKELMLIMTMHKFDQYWSICISFFLPNLLTSSNFGQYPSHNSLKSEETMFRTLSWLAIFEQATMHFTGSLMDPNNTSINLKVLQLVQIRSLYRNVNKLTLIREKLCWNTVLTSRPKTWSPPLVNPRRPCLTADQDPRTPCSRIFGT